MREKYTEQVPDWYKDNNKYELVLSNDIDSLVSGIGTGGTLIGTGKRIKEVYKDAKVIGLEPNELPIITKGITKGTHKIEGIGDDFIPSIVDMNVIDKVVTVSDSTGWVYDAEGIDLDALKEIKEVKRARLSEYPNYRPNAEYHAGKGVWSVKVDIALPCATQNELLLDDAKALVANGVIAVCEGANMPTTLEATHYLQENGVIFAPGKAANAGGVATSALEMSQNSERLSWSFEEVDAKLQTIMVNICHNMANAAEKYGFPGNYVVGANIAGFEKVVDAMMAQGIV